MQVQQSFKKLGQRLNGERPQENVDKPLSTHYDRDDVN